MLNPGAPWVGRVVDLVTGGAAAWATWRAKRAKKVADTNQVQLEQWQALANEWQREIRECRAERDKQRVEMSKLRTEVIALQKIHKGEFPELADIDAEIARNPPG